MADIRVVELKLNCLSRFYHFLNFVCLILQTVSLMKLSHLK